MTTPSPIDSANPFTRPNPFAAPPQAAPARRSPGNASTFERRFLSERFRGGPGMLEIASLWRNNVIGVDSHREAKAALTIGAHGATYLVESAALEETVALLEPLAGAWRLHVHPGMEGFVVAPGRDGRSRRLSLDEAVAAGLARRGERGGYTVTINATTRAKVLLGEQSFLVHYVSAPSLRLPLVARVGLAGLVVAVLLSLAAHLTFGALVSLSTDRVEELTIDHLVASNAYGHALVQPEVEEEPEPEEVVEDSAEESKAAVNARLGDPSKPEGAGRESGPPSSRERGGQPGDARSVAQQAGLTNTLQAFANQSASPGDFDDELMAWNAFDASAPGAPGDYGLGPANAGSLAHNSFAGPGSGPGGGFDTGGKGDPDGDPDGIGPRNTLGDHVKETRKPTLVPRPFDSSGTLTSKQIRKVVSQHKRQLKGIYEKALARHKGLHGKVVVQFIIDTQGNVASAIVLSSTMHNRDVEQGLVKAIKRWRFPAVKNGSLTKVSYPFVFDVK